jgi:hypothetical protein
MSAFNWTNKPHLHESENPQGSQEWKDERIGLITGSQIFNLMTNAKKAGELSVSAKTYLNGLVTDIIAGNVEDLFVSFDMQRGTDLEPVARNRMGERLKKQNPITPELIQEVGFITSDDWQGCGTSLDGITSKGGTTEYKCRKRQAHLDHLYGADKKTIYQAQFGMGITGGKYCLFGAYSDEFPVDQGDFIMHVIERDEEMIADMKARCIVAVQYIDEKVLERTSLLADQLK